MLDPRVHAVRDDIADIALADRRFAPHYARAEHCECASASAMMRAAPSGDAPAVSQLLRGEGFAVVDVAAGWAWGYSRHDDYVGYVPQEALGPIATPTHRVAVSTALVFARASIKSEVREHWSLGVRFAGMPEDDFLATDAGFVHRRHAAPLEAVADDLVDVAERLLGAPYLWGGRGAGGIDCSGLVQLALGLCGTASPRDSDQQQAALGRAVGDDEPSQRGDLAFLPGHVGMMADADTLLHANAWWMAVVREPLADVLARQPEGTRAVRRRLSA